MTIEDYITAHENLKPIFNEVSDLKFFMPPRHQVGDKFVPIRNLLDGKSAYVSIEHEPNTVLLVYFWQ